MSHKFSITIKGNKLTTNLPRQITGWKRLKSAIEWFEDNDKTYKAAAIKFKYGSAEVLSKALKKIGYVRDKAFMFISDSLVNQAIKHHMAGNILPPFAKEHGVSNVYLGEKMRKAGYSLRDRKFIGGNNLTYTQKTENKKLAYWQDILYNPTLSYRESQNNACSLF